MKKLLLIFFFLLTNFNALLACRYTVREIGYSDLDTPNFTLVLVPSDDDSAQIRTFNRISYAALLNSNIQNAAVGPEFDADPVLQTEIDKKVRQKAGPFLLLKDERTKKMFFWPLDKNDFKESLWTALEFMVISKVREDLFFRLARSFAVVMLVDGKNESQNQEYRNRIKSVIRDINTSLQDMAKPVSEPAAFMELDFQQRQAETLLLWSLGLDESAEDQALVVIFYGRGRMMGPALVGGLTEEMLYNRLSIVGADCECGLERTWILGRMIPLRWESQWQDEITSRLGFDVENPVVKNEMQRIISFPQNNIVQNKTRSYDINNEINQQKDSENSNKPLFRKIILIIIIFCIILFLLGITVYIIAKRNRN